jgi:hypothetical protein
LYWRRFTTFTEELSTALEKKIVQHLPKRATFYKMDFRVDNVFTHKAEHAWAGQSSFSDKAQDASNCKSAHDVHMEFVSPTAFRNNGLDICIPAASQVFRSLWARWNAFCPEPMQIQTLQPVASWSMSLLLSTQPIGFLQKATADLPAALRDNGILPARKREPGRSLASLL